MLCAERCTTRAQPEAQKTLAQSMNEHGVFVQARARLHVTRRIGWRRAPNQRKNVDPAARDSSFLYSFSLSSIGKAPIENLAIRRQKHNATDASRLCFRRESVQRVLSCLTTIELARVR